MEEFASSLLFSGYFLGALATMLPFGILADRFGNLRFIGLGIILTVISGLIIFFSENLWILLVSRFIEGAACGAFFPAAFSTLSRCKDPGRYIGEFTFLFNAGLASGALLLRFAWQTFFLKVQSLFSHYDALFWLHPFFQAQGTYLPPETQGK